MARETSWPSRSTPTSSCCASPTCWRPGACSASSRTTTRADPRRQRITAAGVASEIAVSHHERWDGTGYPHQLAGEQIPLSGRIVAVADVYDALVYARPYKDAWSVNDAVAEIAAEREHHFDPSVVDAFMDLDHQALTTPAKASAPSPLLAGVS
ncbi:MAG TPA: HD domain-containing phosphohydrolase [Baekduia sp.]|nr:HD domain-containing phosphohydrolase [Baekduia sp.]